MPACRVNSFSNSWFLVSSQAVITSQMCKRRNHASSRMTDLTVRSKTISRINVLSPSQPQLYTTPQLVKPNDLAIPFKLSKRNFSVTARLLPPAKLEIPRSKNYIASFLPQCLSQCLLSALAKLPKCLINIRPSVSQAASISLSANPCLFVPQSLPHSHLGLLQRGQVPPSLHLIHWTLMLSWAKQHDGAPPYQPICNLASKYQSFSYQFGIKIFHSVA